MNKFKSYIKRIIKLINLEEMKTLPGHLAFNIVLMIVPIFSIIGVIGSNFEVAKIINVLDNNVPDAVLSIIDSAFEEKEPTSVEDALDDLMKTKDIFDDNNNESL